jgi:hypothetical protein
MNGKVALRGVSHQIRELAQAEDGKKSVGDLDRLF